MTPTNNRLEEQLPLLLPAAIAWAEAAARDGRAAGLPLDAARVALAESVGVRHASAIRLVVVDEFPAPSDPALRQAGMQMGLLGAHGLGLTLGYAVFVRRGHEAGERLLRHEFRHVQQFERRGSLAAFLTEYLSQVVRFGYHDAPLEADARAHEAGEGNG